MGLRLLQAFVLLGALLLFALEPTVGKLLTPSYGGGYHVWATCLMVFQGLLLLGYIYAHWLAPRLGRWHLAVVVLPLITLPLTVDALPGAKPIPSIVRDVLFGIGPLFFALSTTSVVAQDWLARSTLKERDEPYQLYGVSNFGSMLGLLAYPFVIEPLLGLQAQRIAWSVAYGAWAIVAAVTWHVTCPAPHAPGSSHDAPAPSRLAYWFLLSAAPSAFLVAVTNVIAIDAGSFPLVWVLPLAVYLFSFILLFGRTPRFPSLLKRFWPELTVLGLFFYGGGAVPWVWVNVGVHLLALFAVCMAGHGELHRVRPEPRHLTVFYLVLSMGGFAGGFFVSSIAPVLFTGLWEYPVSALVLLATIGIARREAFGQWVRTESKVMVGASAVFIGLVGLRAIQADTGVGDKVEHAAERNFYGVYRVWETDEVMLLVHGTTIHGKQRKDDPGLPLGYYHPDSPCGQVMTSVPHTDAALVGLGAGAMAAYFDPGDELIFYELDPTDTFYAKKYFTYLSDSKGHVDVIHGDARISLQTAQDGRFDLLVIDAFSSDAIPTHLLTVEALQLYQRKLRPGGTLLLHISNRYYDLRSKLAATGAELGLKGIYKVDTELSEHEQMSAWFVMSPDDAALEPFLSKGWSRADPADSRPWTDDHAHTLGLLFAGGLLD